MNFEEVTRPKNMLFIDFGGTLADTLTPAQLAFNEFFGKSFSLQEIAQLFKDSLTMSRLQLARKYKLSIRQWLAGGGSFELLIERYFLQKTHIYPELLAFLRKLKTQYSIVVVLLSRNALLNDKEIRKAYLTRYELHDVFDVFLTSDDKLHELSLYLRHHPVNHGMLVGDLCDDARIAKAFHLPYYLVSWGYSTQNELLECIDDPSRILTNFTQFQEALEKEIQKWKH